MKKGYYIYVENCGSSGVYNKIAMQIEAFNTRFDVQGIIVKSLERTLIQRIFSLLAWNSIPRDYQCVINKLNNPDFIYIRKTYVDKMYLTFLDNIKRKYPNCKIIVEIPVYPYKREMLSTCYTIFMYFKEVLYRSKYKEHIDRFVTYSDDDEIFGVPTIKTMNGVNVKSISPIKADKEYNPDEIHLITVALLARHHGYERVIAGLHDYYSVERKRKVYFHIVGNGAEGKKYRRMVKKYKLEDYVKFYGVRVGGDLDALYNIADAGLAAFGVYKDGFSKLSTIKAREYLAKGLPVILGAADDLVLDEGNAYGLKFPNDASVVDVKRIIEYLDNLYLEKGKSLISSKIREYAFKYVDNKVTLLPVMDYIDS